ncbi:AAA family ATPase [Thiocystis violacea]|uniref:AAA family ATPase n=1 Tax=Thiocystis violacea TaxID=13725 RepID=UPI001904E047|nr:ATP-binding protein [Thiocystis violacea]MBK1718762.1 chromosome segregation protein SMC [Thiocystis violacea]
MRIDHIRLKNWLNFRKVDATLSETTYLIGPNASGKSNLLDVFRFLRTLADTAGGGLQKAVAERGGIKKLRCLQARQDNEVRIEVQLSEGVGEDRDEWRYVIGFKSEGTGLQRPVVHEERVEHNGSCLLSRPDAADIGDKERLTQSHLEQVNANLEFRVLANFFRATTYLHLVPQLLKFADRLGSNRLEEDPFGQGFLDGLARTLKTTRDARLRKIQQVLTKAVPQFKELRFVRDEITGLPHLEARYAHWRPQGAWHREDQLSDGTLRLIALLWSLLDGDSLLLLEEPELSLNDEIVRQIPLMIDRIKRQAKYRRQILITTHSEAMLNNPIDGRAILLVIPTDDGSEIRGATEDELSLLANGISPAEVLLPKARPQGAEQLGLF